MYCMSSWCSGKKDISRNSIDTRRQFLHLRSIGFSSTFSPQFWGQFFSSSAVWEYFPTVNCHGLVYIN